MRKPGAARDPFARAIEWRASGDPERPYEADVDGARWQVRLNDWPDYPAVYTLLGPGGVAVDFDEWPAAWQRPST